MDVALEGSSPAALTAGILLLSRARSFGFPLRVQVVGSPGDITSVPGPCMVHSPVLASCGIGRDLGSGALVIVPGPTEAPLAICLEDGGNGDWFEVDRRGGGLHPHSVAFVALCRERRPALRELGRQLRRAFMALGCTPEPAVLDLLFTAPAPPLTRLAIALRAARAMSGQRGLPWTRFLAGGQADLPEPLPDDLATCSWAQTRPLLRPHLDRLGLGTQDAVEAWIGELAQEDPEELYGPMARALAAVLSHLLTLPSAAMLPPLQPSRDAVAVGLGPALGAAGPQHDANAGLAKMFHFLGGRFCTEARFPVRLEGNPPPEGRLARWRWFCAETTRSAQTADVLWRQVMDPAQ